MPVFGIGLSWEYHILLCSNKSINVPWVYQLCNILSMMEFKSQIIVLVSSGIVIVYLITWSGIHTLPTSCDKMQTNNCFSKTHTSIIILECYMMWKYHILVSSNKWMNNVTSFYALQNTWIHGRSICITGFTLFRHV